MELRERGKCEYQGSAWHADTTDHGVVQASFRSSLANLALIQLLAVVVDAESDEAADNLAGEG